MIPTRDQLIDLILRETTDKVTADGVQIAAPNILEVGCRYVRGDPRRGYEKPADAARQFAGFIADAFLALAPRPGFSPFDVEDYVADYEFRADGDGGSYSPNENERALLIDAIHGALSELSLTTPARAEAQDEGAAGEASAYRVRMVSDDPAEWVLMHPEKALDFLSRKGWESQPLYAHPSPTPAADADRVRIAVEALEKIRLQSEDNLGVRMETITSIADQALAALKSTAAKEGGAE